MLIHNKDDIEFVTEFPCLLGHPVHVERIHVTYLCTGWECTVCWSKAHLEAEPGSAERIPAINFNLETRSCQSSSFIRYNQCLYDILYLKTDWDIWFPIFSPLLMSNIRFRWTLLPLTAYLLFYYLLSTLGGVSYCQTRLTYSVANRRRKQSCKFLKYI